MGLGRLGLFLSGNVGIGPQGESGIVVASIVEAVLKGQRSEVMVEIAEHLQKDITAA